MRRLIAALVCCLLNIPVHAEDCVASVYAVGDSSQPGTKTASGIPHDDNAMTAAHKSLPFGSKVKVTNKKSGDTVTVTIMDRGPYVKGRCIVQGRCKCPWICRTCSRQRRACSERLDIGDTLHRRPPQGSSSRTRLR